jgi:hypothetical protein
LNGRKENVKSFKGGEKAETTRLRCVTIKLKISTSKKRSVNHHALTLIPCSFPQSGFKKEELDSFIQKFSFFYSSSDPTKMFLLSSEQTSVPQSETGN